MKKQKNTFWKKLALALIVSLAASACAHAQGYTMADLQQDFALMKREVGQLRLQVEELQRANEALSKKLNAAQNQSASGAAVSSQVNAARAEAAARDEALKKEIIAQVKKDLDAVVAQTNSAIEKLAKAIGSRPQSDLPKTFSSDYPQTGIAYVVKSGDTISKIASENKSRVSWIQNANKIANPARDLKIGDKIFVPQE